MTRKGALTGRLQTGDVITGKCSYDTADSDEQPAVPGIGDYTYTQSPFGVTINAGNVILQTKLGGCFLIEMIDNYSGLEDYARECVGFTLWQWAPA